MHSQGVGGLPQEFRTLLPRHLESRIWVAVQLDRDAEPFPISVRPSQDPQGWMHVAEKVSRTHILGSPGGHSCGRLTSLQKGHGGVHGIVAGDFVRRFVVDVEGGSQFCLNVPWCTVRDTIKQEKAARTGSRKGKPLGCDALERTTAVADPAIMSKTLELFWQATWLFLIQCAAVRANFVASWWSQSVQNIFLSEHDVGCTILPISPDQGEDVVGAVSMPWFSGRLTDVLHIIQNRFPEVALQLVTRVKFGGTQIV